MGYIIAGYIFIVLVIALIKKVKAYDAFLEGVKEGTQTVLNMFSTLLAFVLVVESIKACGILEDISELINANLLVQSIIRPLSASSSMAIMLQTYQEFGVDSRISISSTFIHSVIDTSFYIIVLYFSSCNIKNYKYAFSLALIIIFIAYILIYLVIALFY